MLFNFHTHTSFCDGKNTAEEMVETAIREGFCSLGFSGHGYTAFDQRYCITDVSGYRAEIIRLKEKYKKDIQIYLGVEEDILGRAERADFDYVIGSSHYYRIGEKLFDVDGSMADTLNALKECGGDPLNLAEIYYSNFTDYILWAKPDIVGHFDLLTKFDEKDTPLFLNNKEYEKIAEKYLTFALKSDCIFELNTGAISRGYRTTPYPAENLLHIMKKNNAKITISSDAHKKENLSFGLSEAKEYLSYMGFKKVYALCDGKFSAFDLN